MASKFPNRIQDPVPLNPVAAAVAGPEGFQEVPVQLGGMPEHPLLAVLPPLLPRLVHGRCLGQPATAMDHKYGNSNKFILLPKLCTVQLFRIACLKKLKIFITNF
jgi:hypothetical protein